MRHFTVTPKEYRNAVISLARLWDTIRYRHLRLGKAAEAVKLARYSLGK